MPAVGMQIKSCKIVFYQLFNEYKKCEVLIKKTARCTAYPV